MLTEILNRSTCAECRTCCVFDKTDMWEAPILSDDNIKRSLEINPDTCFLEKGTLRIFAMDKDENGLYKCPMLSENGCIMKDSKPFDCKIWPFRVMDFNGRNVITLSPVCSSMYSKPINELQNFLKKGLAEIIFNEAQKNPAIIKEYIKDYPILITE